MPPSFPVAVHSQPSSSPHPPPPHSFPYAVYPAQHAFFHPSSYPYPYPSFYPLYPPSEPGYSSHPMPSPYHYLPTPPPVYYPAAPADAPPPHGSSRPRKSRRSRKTLGSRGGDEDDSESSDDSDDEEDDEEGGTSSRRQSQVRANPQPAPAVQSAPQHGPLYSYFPAHYHPYFTQAVPSSYVSPHHQLPSHLYQQQQQQPPYAYPSYHPPPSSNGPSKVERTAHDLMAPHSSAEQRRVAGQSVDEKQSERDSQGGTVYTIPTAPQPYYYHPAAVPVYAYDQTDAQSAPPIVLTATAPRTPTVVGLHQPAPLRALLSTESSQALTSPHSPSPDFSRLSPSTHTLPSPLSATSEVPDESSTSPPPVAPHSPSSLQHINSLPTYSSSITHLHPPHGALRSVDDFALHLHTQDHDPSAPAYSTDPSRALDDLSAQPAAAYPEGHVPQHRPAPEYTHYQGAKGRIFRVRDITSSYSDGENRSRASSYTVGGHPVHPYMPDSPQPYGIDHPAMPPALPGPVSHAAYHGSALSGASVGSRKTKKSKKDEIHFADLRFGDKIGEGSFGEVFRGTLWGQEVAIKKLRIKGLDANSNAGISREFRKEVKIMRTLRHPNIVEFLGVCMEPSNLCLVTEFLSNGSLEDVLERITVKEGKKFSLKRCISLAKDIARGLNWLHHSTPSATTSHVHTLDGWACVLTSLCAALLCSVVSSAEGIIHRDLKTANILIDSAGRAKICDFGLSHVMRRFNMSGSYGICGTPSYMAPEVLKKQSYGVKADVFSFGICLCELITGKYPYENEPESTTTFEAAIMAGLRPAIPAYCPVSIRALITSCWSDDPELRPSVDEIMDTLVATERQLLAAENLTILDELPEELSKLFEEAKAENAFLTMSIKQLKGQLDAAQARATEWEEKWEKERAIREDLDKAVKALREQLHAVAHPAHPHTQTMPVMMSVPVLLRATSNASGSVPGAVDGVLVGGSRRMSATGALPPGMSVRRSQGTAPVTASPPLPVSQSAHGATTGLIVSPHAVASRHLQQPHPRSPYHSTASPRGSPSSSPSPILAHGVAAYPPPLANVNGAVHNNGHAQPHGPGGASASMGAMPVAALLSPTKSDPLSPKTCGSPFLILSLVVGLALALTAEAAAGGARVREGGCGIVLAFFPARICFSFGIHTER